MKNFKKLTSIELGEIYGGHRRTHHSMIHKFFNYMKGYYEGIWHGLN